MPASRTLETEIQGILSSSDTTVTRNPLTQAMPTTLLQWLKVHAWFGASTGLKVRPYVEFSDDGVVWNNAKELATSYWTTQGWNFMQDAVDVYNLTSTTPRRFCRFGLEALNTTASSSTTELGEARLRIDLAPVTGGSVSTGYVLVHTKGSTSNAVFVPVTDDMNTGDANEYRRTLDIACSSGDVSIQIGYQLTDTPDDPTSWGTAVAEGSAVTSGIEHATTFDGLDSTYIQKRVARWGFYVTNTAGAAVEAALVRLVLDWRK